MALCALVLASVVVAVEAKAFLHADVSAKSSRIALVDVEEALFAQMDASRLEYLQQGLRPMYMSLPKGEHGGLEPAAVRYALHRYFMQKHGWHIKGLGPASNMSKHSSASAVIMKERAPSHIQSVFERSLHGQGLDLRRLAVFAAALTDLIHNEVAGSLSEICETLELPVGGSMTRQESRNAVTAYLLSYLSGNAIEFSDREELRAAQREFEDNYLAWPETRDWVNDLRGAFELSLSSRRNPFVQHQPSFGETAAFLQEVGHRFGSFQNLECRRIKDQLVSLEHEGTGRVYLSEFYGGGLQGKWQFTESVDYLRHIHALDDTDPDRLSVVIPNYLHSKTNCLEASSFYSICCSDECEALFGHIEQEVMTPSVSPWRIAEVVSALESDTVPAPRNLSATLLARLESIADLHGGLVPLHGRLFAQWMHHAYPRECSFPHMAAGVHETMSPNEFSEAFDLDTAEASEEEMRLHSVMTPVTKSQVLPWIHVEDLVAEHRHTTMGSSSALLRAAVAVVGVGAMVVKLYSSAAAGSSPVSGKSDRFLV